MHLALENIIVIEEGDTLQSIEDWIEEMTDLYRDEIRPEDWILDPTVPGFLIIFNSEHGMARLDATVGKPKPPRKEVENTSDVPFFALEDGGDWEHIRQKLLAAGYNDTEAGTIVTRLAVAAAQEIGKHNGSSQPVQQGEIRDSESPA